MKGEERKRKEGVQRLFKSLQTGQSYTLFHIPYLNFLGLSNLLPLSFLFKLCFCFLVLDYIKLAKKIQKQLKITRRTYRNWLKSATEIGYRFGDFCSTSFLPLLPQLVCSIHATLERLGNIVSFRIFSEKRKLWISIAQIG